MSNLPLHNLQMAWYGDNQPGVDDGFNNNFSSVWYHHRMVGAGTVRGRGAVLDHMVRAWIRRQQKQFPSGASRSGRFGRSHEHFSCLGLGTQHVHIKPGSLSKRHRRTILVHLGQLPDLDLVQRVCPTYPGPATRRIHSVGICARTIQWTSASSVLDRAGHAGNLCVRYQCISGQQGLTDYHRNRLSCDHVRAGRPGFDLHLARRTQSISDH